MKDAFLALEDGTVFRGRGIGSEGLTRGELVFNTSFTGYEEAMTGPSYKGQVLMFTYPLVGNYGFSYESIQSEEVGAEAVVVREACDNPSHRNSEATFDEFLKDMDTPGIEGIDTRMLTIKTRERGTLKAAVAVGDYEVDEVVEYAKGAPDIQDLDLVSEVSCNESYSIEGDGSRIAVLDCGVRKSILDRLSEKDFDIKVFPADSSSDLIREFDPDGILVSNGPGNPKMAKAPINLVKDLVGELPVFGICFGTQIISLAVGADTYKMNFGHRGANHPVKDHETGTVHITSQNHGFAIDKESLDGTGLNVVQTNANDGTVEAVENEELDIYGVQYHPEAEPGPRDTKDLFLNKVLKIIEG
ncbi:glutamine-hydrolyzing carbamoyl-phosphate synthase small subunit [Methanonatronarchaeum sp. AMET-Sl]|uniref:glutamine-hydrolyzing carbamoyl-phosphate synthase small subunit n=1 Tax=Methanonatronarchaeum sp. AMET-Sl TaxID=3037654 RepID=UPI00244DA6BF|nr:glutamine-hydrolyzing carbamoyl-phosphate synthase small subunit [Methanonatronarchaeum sp. AMET-Sl]WGI17425.1 glutamine-hydrolyzing carbamoyl-phosphate synthase small subunit [Methanonatronarchaeum sp. AMET-Sl]